MMTEEHAWEEAPLSEAHETERKGTAMPAPHEQRSEVARLLAQINSEYEAVR